MAKPEWGTKRICPNCGVRYYDLHRDPITCPKCQAAFDPEALLKTRRARVAAAPVEEEVIETAAEEVDTEAEVEEADVDEDALPVEADEGEEEEEIIEDASELGEDEDDMAEVIENVDDDEER